jgi:hypothetical protein
MRGKTEILCSPEDIPLYCCVYSHNHKILYTQQDAIYKVSKFMGHKMFVEKSQNKKPFWIAGKRILNES